MMAPAALGHMRTTGTCVSSRTVLMQQQHSLCGRLLAGKPVHRARVVVAAARAAADGPGREQTHLSEDAAPAAARQLVAAVLEQQEGSATPDDSTVEGETPAAGSTGTTTAPAGIITAAEADVAAAGMDDLQEPEHLASLGLVTDSAETAETAAAVYASAEEEHAADAAEEQGEEQAEAASVAGGYITDEAESDNVAAAAQQGSAGDSGTEQDTADMLQQIDNSIAPALARFGLDDLLIPQLQRHMQQHGKFKRSFLSYSIYVSSTCLLCDPRVYAQWCQGVLTCYLLTLWLLGVEQLPLAGVHTKWHHQGPPALCSNRAIVMQMSVAGDLLSAVRSRFGHAGRPGSGTSRETKTPSTTRELLLNCPWMHLSQASSDARENRLTLRLQLLGYAASKERLGELLPLLNEAVYTAFGVRKAGAAASAGLVAAVAAEAVGTKGARKIRQGILAAAARSAVRYYMNSSPAKLGRMRYMLQHGVPVGVLTLVRFIQDSSPEGQKDKVQAMAGELAAALEGMLATAKPYWVCLRPPASQRSSSSTQNSVWLFNLPLLLKQNVAVQVSAAHLLPAPASKAPAAAAAAAAARTEATAEKQHVAGALAGARQQRLSGGTELTEVAAVDPHTAGKPVAAAAAMEAAGTAPVAAASAVDSMPAAAATALHSFAATGGRATAAAHAAATAFAASRGNAGAAAAGMSAAHARGAAIARLAALYGPHQEAKRGPVAGLDYMQCLPGLGPVQVVTISSAASAAYSSMLQHMAAVSLLGMDTESSWLGNDGSVTVVLSFMAPGVPASGSDPGWLDTVYIIDLVAAGMQQRSSSSSSNSSSNDNSSGGDSSSGGGSQAAEAAAASAASELVAGLAAVFEDPGCTLVVQDASQDLPLLQAEFGLSPVNVIDTQLCHIVLGAVRQQQGLHVKGRRLMRRRLEVLLGAYGLSHPNKMEVVALSRANPMLWLTAPRPLSPELLAYLAADVRYLPALVLLMERDLLQASPGALMRELQPALPRRLQPPLTHNSTSLLQSITQQLMQQQQQDSQGILALPDGSWTLPAVTQGLSSKSSSGNAYTDSSWIEPGADDTMVSNLVFMLPRVKLSGTSPGQLQQLLQNPAKPAHQLMVPLEAVAAAEHAVVAARAGKATGSESPVNPGGAGVVQQQQQQQHQQQQGGQQGQQHSSSNSSNGRSSGSTSSTDTGWRADHATEHLLSLLPERLAKALRSNMATAAASFMRHQTALRDAAAGADPAAAAAMPPLIPQLLQLHIMLGSPITYRLGVSGVGAAAASSVSSLMGFHEQLFVLKLPRKEALSLGLTAGSGCGGTLLQKCVDELWRLREVAYNEEEDTAADESGNARAPALGPLLFGSFQQRSKSGLMHFVAPIGVPNGKQPCRASLRSNSNNISRSSSRTDCNDWAGSGELPPGTAAQQQQQQQPQCEEVDIAHLKGLLFSAARRQTGISQVIGDLLASITQQALALNALGGTAQHTPLQLAAAPPPTWLHSRSSSGREVRGSMGAAQAGSDPTPAQPQQDGNAALRQQLAAARDIAAWRLGVQPPSCITSAAAVGSSSSGIASLLVLLLGPVQSGKSSMLRDVAATLAENSCVSVAAVDMHDRLAGSVAIQTRLLGSALQLQVDSPASQAAAVQSAWQLHKCHVIILNSLSSKALPAVQAALAAGISVVAAANGFVDLAALHESSGAAASQAAAAGASGSSGTGSSSSTNCEAAALWDLLCRLSSDGSRQRCSVVECVPGYRWTVHKQLARSLQLLQQAPAADSAAAAAAVGPAGHAAVLPVQLRQFMPVGANGVPAAAAVDSTGQLTQQQQGTSATGSSSGSSEHSSNGSSSVTARSNDSAAVGQAGGVVAVSRFASYGAAAGDLPLPLLLVVRELLYGQAHHNSQTEGSK